jgi:predicted kinase
MSRNVKGLWNVVLSGYPRSGKTLLARKLVADYPEFARLNVDELREMLFNECPPCRDEYIIYSLIAEMRDALLSRGYSVVIDSTAPDDTTRDFLLTTRAKRVNQLLVILTVDRKILMARSIEKCGDTSLVTAWDKRWKERRKECCLFKFRSNDMEEFEAYYDRLTELLASEMHPFRPEFRHTLLPLKEIQKSLRNFLSKRSRG